MGWSENRLPQNIIKLETWFSPLQKKSMEEDTPIETHLVDYIPDSI